MANINRKRGGALAQSYGKGFEDIFLKFCRMSGIAITPIPSGCKHLGKGRMIPVQTPWDWVLTYQSRTALIDTKTIDDFAYPASLIKKHQVDEMLQHERMGSIAGYVIWLRKAKKVFFMPAIALYEYIEMGGSFDETHPKAINLGEGNIFDVRNIFYAIHPIFFPKGIL